MSSIPLKCCTRKERCLHPDGPFLPETTEYFRPKKGYKNGLYSVCRVCDRQDRFTAYHRNPEPRRAASRKQRRKPGAKERNLTENYEWRANNRERWLELKRNEYLRNKPKYQVSKRAYYAIPKNRAAAIERARNQIDNPTDHLIRVHRRLARKRGLPATFTTPEWKRCLSYWNGCCCICGNPPDMWHVLAKEHWIPLVDTRPDNPGTVAWNMLPMCHAKKGSNGLGGCNNSKGNKAPEQWLTETFGKHKADEILKRIHTYFEWVKKQTD